MLDPGQVVKVAGGEDNPHVTAVPCPSAGCHRLKR